MRGLFRRKLKDFAELVMEQHDRICLYQRLTGKDRPSTQQTEEGHMHHEETISHDHDIEHAFTNS